MKVFLCTPVYCDMYSSIMYAHLCWCCGTLSGPSLKFLQVCQLKNEEEKIKYNFPAIVFFQVPNQYQCTSYIYDLVIAPICSQFLC